MSKYLIVAERILSKRISDERIKQQIAHCCKLAFNSNRGSGWSQSPIVVHSPLSKGNDWILKASIEFSPTTDRQSVHDKWPNIVKRFAEAGCASQLKQHPWVVVTPNGYKQIATEAAAKTSEMEELAEEPKLLGEVNIDPKDYYSRIYNRQPQIRRIIDSLHLGQRTDWVKRTNTLLDGEPGGGKTEIMLSTREMLGKENEAWQWYDATSMTKAGVIEGIMKAKVIPPVLFIEEIEKCEEGALRWLLGVMDRRGEIRRTNYRVGNQAKNVRMLVIASANNVKLLKTVLSGALYSRFQNKIYCPEPDRPTMQQILLRELADIKGRESWVEPAIQFGFDKWGITDPRDLINIMSCGGQRLISGEYQQDYEATMHPVEQRYLLKRKDRRAKAAVALLEAKKK